MPNITPDDTTKAKPKFSLDKLKRMFKNAIDATAENDLLAIRDREFFDGDQLSHEDRIELGKRGAPLFYNNKVAPGINGVFGIIDAAENDPQCYPRNSNARQSADIATKLLRYVSDTTDWKKVKKGCSENFIIQGVCAAIVECHPHSKSGKNQITATRIRWEDFFYDPLSRDSDFSDAVFMGTAIWRDANQVKAQFPEQYEEMGDPFGDIGGMFGNKGDLESRACWIDAKRKRLRIVDIYYLDDTGEWNRAIFCEKGLFYFGVSEYKDEHGSSVNPICAETYEIKQDNTRYGAIRNMIELQKEVNARRSKMLQLTNHRQVKQTQLNAPAANAAIAKREAAKADGAIPFGWESVVASDMAQGQMLLMNQSAADLDRLCPTPAILGRITSSNESGRARQILQQAGYTELARAFSRLEDLELAVYRQMWLRIKQYYDEPMEIRVSGQIKAPEFMTINEPVVEMHPQPVAGPDGQPMIDHTTGHPMMQMAAVQVGQKNIPAEMDMEIIISTTPDSATIDQEVWNAMTEMARSLGISPADPTFDMILKLSPIPNIDEKIEQIKAMRVEAAEANAAQTQQQQQIQAAGLQSELALKTAKTSKDNANAAKSTADAERTNLETHMMAAQSLANMPQMPVPIQPNYPNGQ
jgi:hypothetical protein